jgi:preprotein translocase subunit SecG
MMVLAAIGWQHYMFMVPLALLSVFLILVILVQRGRGGGLTGALGGMGGQSAFGTKAGDLFTRITIVVAAIWVLLSMASLKVLNEQGSSGGLNAGERSLPPPAAKSGLDTPAATLPGDDKSTGTELEKGLPAEPAKTSDPASGTDATKTPPASPPPAATTPPADSQAPPADAAKP